MPPATAAVAVAAQNDFVAQAVQLRQRLAQLWGCIKVLTALPRGIRLGPLQGQCVFSKMIASAQFFTVPETTCSLHPKP